MKLTVINQLKDNLSKTHTHMQQWVIDESRPDEHFKVEAELMLDSIIKSDLDTIDQLSTKWMKTSGGIEEFKNISAEVASLIESYNNEVRNVLVDISSYQDGFSSLMAQTMFEEINSSYEAILVSINNLSLNENDIGDFKTFLKLSPPLRKEEDREALVQGLKDKTIDVIVSDHKPEDEESKRLTFSQAATGASGIETLLSLSLELYHNGSVKLETIIQALTSNPAKILRINKGNLSIGNDADFCIVDLDKPWIVKKENLISKSKNTSIEDKKLQGKVTNTFVKGKELFKI